MTNTRHTIDRARLARAASLTAIVAGTSLMLTGCSESSEPEQAAPQVRRPAPPPPPATINLDGLIQTLNADARVSFSPNVETDDEALARAAITLASAIASGDASALDAVLTEDARNVSASLVSSGAWASATEPIEAVRITALSDSSMTIAVQDPSGAYPLIWSIDRDSGSPLFFGETAPSVEVTSATEFDNGIPQPEAQAGAGFTVSLRFPTMEELAAKSEDPEFREYLTRYSRTHSPWIAQLDAPAFFLNYNLGNGWSKAVAGLDLNSDQGLAMAARQYSSTPDELRQRLADGRAAWNEGGQPPITPELMLASIESYTKLPGFNQPERAVIAEIASITGLTSSEIRGLADRGRQSGPSIFAQLAAEFEPAASNTQAPADEQEEADDPNSESVNSPVGPINVPTGRPGGG